MSFLFSNRAIAALGAGIILSRRKMSREDVEAKSGRNFKMSFFLINSQLGRYPNSSCFRPSTEFPSSQLLLGPILSRSKTLLENPSRLSGHMLLPRTTRKSQFLIFSDTL